MRGRRLVLANARPDFSHHLARFAGALGLAPGTMLAGYRALAGEADPADLIAALQAEGCLLALPRVFRKDAALEFHSHRRGDPLAKSAFGVLEPLPSAPLAVPSVLLVPLLAFDAQGRRLGYGGGFYDRSLQALRARGPVVAIGVAFAGQAVAHVPHGPRDQILDAVLTEDGLRRFA